jgi:exosortase
MFRTLEGFKRPLLPFVPAAWGHIWLNPFTIGLLFIVVPTMLRIAQQSWTTEMGAHGPIVLATGSWLLSHNGLHTPREKSTLVFSTVMVAALSLYIPIYVFGRAYDFLFVEVFAAYIIFLFWFCRFFGFAEVLRQAFPLFYLAFLIPIPGALISATTMPLQMLVSSVAAGVLHAAGYPIAQEGVSLFIAQYQLLVEDACAGLNSLVGLIAIGLFYIYVLHRASWRYAALLTLFIVPVAILANIARVVGLILLTFYFGDATAQGFMHETTGFVLFGLGLLLIIGVDTALRRILRVRRT